MTRIEEIDYEFANSEHKADFDISAREAEKARMNLLDCERSMAWAAIEDLEEKLETVGGRCIGIHPTLGVFVKTFGPGEAGRALCEFTANYGDKLGEDLVGWSPAAPPDWSEEAGGSIDRDDDWQTIDLTTLTGEAKIVPCTCYFEKHDTRPNQLATSLRGDEIEGRIAFMVERADSSKSA